MANQWFKFYGGEYLSDPKIASLSAQERSCWVTLLSLASISSTPGKIDYLTIEVLLEKSGIRFDPYHPEEWNACLSILERFSKMKMITKNDEGSIEVTNWAKRQETALTNAERQARFREKNKGNEIVTNKSYESNARIEENRIDKNREKEKSSKQDFPPSEVLLIEEIKVDNEGKEVKKEEKKQSDPAWPIYQECVRLVSKDAGFEVATSSWDFKKVKDTLNILGDKKHVVSLVEDLITNGTAHTKGYSLAKILSSSEINKYKYNL